MHGHGKGEEQLVEPDDARVVRVEDPDDVLVDELKIVPDIRIWCTGAHIEFSPGSGIT